MSQLQPGCSELCFELRTIGGSDLERQRAIEMATEAGKVERGAAPAKPYTSSPSSSSVPAKPAAAARPAKAAPPPKRAPEPEPEPEPEPQPDPADEEGNPFDGQDNSSGDGGGVP